MKVARAALTMLLIYLPVQTLLASTFESQLLTRGLRWVDEIALLILLPVAFRIRIKTSKPLVAGESLLLATFAFFAAAAVASAAFNRVPTAIATLGTIDYLKGFCFLFVFAAFCADRAWLQRTYRLLLAIAILGALCAIAQEILWLIRGSGPEIRLGLHRAPGFFAHPNSMGLYLLMMLVLAACLDVGGRWLGLLYVGLALSVSRMVHGAFTMLGVLLVINMKRFWLIPLIAVSVAAVSLMSKKTYIELAPAVSLGQETGRAELLKRLNFRGYALYQGKQAWLTSPALGVGPGRFGGVVSVITNSPIYRDLPWEPHQFEILQRTRSLDQFPIQLLAELGAVGAAAFACVYLSVLFSLWRTRHQGDDYERRFVIGLMLAWLLVPFYCLGAGLNKAEILITLSALTGALLGIRARHSSRTPDADRPPGHDIRHADGASGQRYK